MTTTFHVTFPTSIVSALLGNAFLLNTLQGRVIVSASKNHNSTYKRNQNMQESTLQTSNKFDILVSVEDPDNEDYKEVTYYTSDQTLRGNKNKTGPTLGQVCHKNNSSVDISQSLEGNKNKTGYKLGDSTHELHHAIEHNQQANLQSRGNKNGIRAKLGVLPSYDKGNAMEMTEQTVKTSSLYKQNEKVIHAGNVNACHDLSCVQQTGNDSTCMIYDMANPVHRRR